MTRGENKCTTWLSCKSQNKNKKNSGTCVQNCLFETDKKILDNAVVYLRQANCNIKSTSAKPNCREENANELRTDHQVKLRCRQLPSVAQELRKALIRQDWNEARSIAMIICNSRLKLYGCLAIKACLMLLLNHPKSNTHLLQNFIRLITGYVLEEDIIRFTKILCILRKTSLKSNGSITFLKNNYYKVVKDPEFDGIS
ncbi:hypothetical protein RUM44_002348 [Polyplax serrata]|uniref:Uncharacterized protein n=1 Tax=Polyplax serrata TaxID=468196 RepID=A0ABR1AMQ1_POLSC